MTWDDLYLTIAVLMPILVLACIVGLLVDYWPELVANHRARVDAHVVAAWFTWATWWARARERPATVRNPADPSPTPRRAR